MSPNRISRPPLSAWQSSSLRLTAFTTPDSKISEQNWWAEVVGEPPEKITSQPRTGAQVAAGSYNNGKLLLVVQPTRVDWRYEAVAEDTSIQLPQIPFLGSVLDTLPQFQELMSRWLDLQSNPPLVRLAYGAVLLQPVESLEAGYELLSAYLPYNLKLEGSSDFLYQINRLRTSRIEIPDLRINRLSKWSVAMFTSVAFSLTITPDVRTSIQPSIQPSEPVYAGNLELDINTTPDFQGELEREKLVALFDELINLGKEIATKGDLP